MLLGAEQVRKEEDKANMARIEAEEIKYRKKGGGSRRRRSKTRKAKKNQEEPKEPKEEPTGKFDNYLNNF